MKNKKIILGILLISSGLPAATPKNVKDFFSDNASSIGCVILALIGGYFYGEYRNKKRHAVTEAESVKRVHEWCKAHNIPSTLDEKQRQQEIHQKKVDALFCETFKLDVYNYLFSTNDLQVDADGIPLFVQKDLPHFKQLIGETAFTAYSNHIKKCLTDAGYTLNSKISARV